MANNVLQNSQRGIIFITFMIVTVFFIFTVIRLIKKLLDGGEGESKYEEGNENTPKKQEVDGSNTNLAQLALEETAVKEDDTTLVKAIKKVIQFQTIIMPIMIVAPLNILTGTSKAFSLVFYIFILLVVVVFNMAAVHRKCSQHKFVRLFLDNIWLVMTFFEILNIWSTSSAVQPYVLIGS